MKKKEANASAILGSELPKENTADKQAAPKSRGSGDGGNMRIYDEPY